MLSQGVVLNDRYVLNTRVATGGMGEVWSAVDTLLNRTVAVKVLLPSLVSDTEFITRFRAEARSMAALRHPGIAEVYDYGENAVVDGDRVDYIVMAYIEGVSLARRLETLGPLSVPETLSVVTQAARALHAAHQAGIVHRDVKPSNLLIQADTTVVLVDFGVARSAAITDLTGSNVILGTPHFMAPEQISGQPVSAATDIYALGAVMYCCLTGQPPFTGANPLHVVSQHLQDAPPPLPPEVPAPVAALVTRALAKDPGDRFPSAAAFAQAAQSIAGVTAPPTVDLGSYAAPSPPAPSYVPPAPSYVPPAPSPAVSSYVPPAAAERRADTAPAGGGNRRRAGIVAAAVGVVVLALIGLVAVPALRPSNDGPSVAGRLVQADETTASAAPSTDSASPAGSPTAAGPTPSASASPTGEAVEPAANEAPSQPAPTAARSAGSTTRPTTTAPTSPSTAPVKNPYTPTQVCGSGYQVIDSAAVTGGRVYLLYKTSTGYNCVVTMKTTSIGTKTGASAYLEVQGKARSTDSGSFAYYAGPVRATAAGVCVKWGGSVGGASYGSPFEHCG